MTTATTTETTLQARRPLDAETVDRIIAAIWALPVRSEQRPVRP